MCAAIEGLFDKRGERLVKKIQEAISKLEDAIKALENINRQRVVADIESEIEILRFAEEYPDTLELSIMKDGYSNNRWFKFHKSDVVFFREYKYKNMTNFGKEEVDGKTGEAVWKLEYPCGVLTWINAQYKEARDYLDNALANIQGFDVLFYDHWNNSLYIRDNNFDVKKMIAFEKDLQEKIVEIGKRKAKEYELAELKERLKNLEND